MSSPSDPTRRAFLLRLARTAAFVPPVMATVDVGSLFAQGKSGGSTTTSSSSSTTTSSSSSSSTSGGKGGTTTGGTTVGSISPTAAVAVEGVEFQSFGETESQSRAPWDTRRPSQPPPWARPPPRGN